MIEKENPTHEMGIFPIDWWAEGIKTSRNLTHEKIAKRLGLKWSTYRLWRKSTTISKEAIDFLRENAPLTFSLTKEETETLEEVIGIVEKNKAEKMRRRKGYRESTLSQTSGELNEWIRGVKIELKKRGAVIFSPWEIEKVGMLTPKVTKTR